MTRNLAISLEDIIRARSRIEGHVIRSPLVPSPRLSELTGAEILVKHENMQATASFKERGAVNRLLALDDAERRQGVIAMSAGNHAQAVAYHARRFGIPATIVMPEFTPLVKVESTRSQGARIVLKGESLQESAEEALHIAKAENLALVHPYDDPLIMAGQGTVALEILEDAAEIDVMVVPVGGGGLFAGNAVAAKSLRPGIEMIGVESALYPTFRNALEGRQDPLGGPTLAEGIAVKDAGRLTLPVVREFASAMFAVGEDHIEQAVNAFATMHHTLAEGAGAAGLAAILQEPERFRGRKVVLLLSGGNIDSRLLAAIMVRELERQSRIVSLRLTSPDRPGVLAEVAGILGAQGANILEVSHSRGFLDVPAKGVTIDVTVETRGEAHALEIADALERKNFLNRRIPPHDFIVSED